MAKLTPEEWKAAFFAVMKETPKVGAKEMGRVADALAKRKQAAGQAIAKAQRAFELAENIHRDRVEKSSAAASRREETRSGTLTTEGRESADKTVREAEASAREAAVELQQARLLLKQMTYEDGALQKQIDEAARRIEAKDYDAFSGPLADVVKQAQLEVQLKEQNKRIEAFQQEVENAGFIDDVAERKEVTARRTKLLDQARSEREAIAALLPGYEIVQAEPSKKNELKEQHERLKLAEQAAGDKLKIDSDKADVSRQTAADAGDALERAALLDPALMDACKLLAAKREALAKAKQAATDATDALKDKSDSYESSRKLVAAYADGSGTPPDEGDLNGALDRLDNLVGLLPKLQAHDRKQRDAVRLAAAAVHSAETALADAIDQRAAELPGDSDLPKARDALLKARADLRAADGVKAQAKGDADRVRGLADEARRRLQLTETMPAAQNAVAEFNKALKGVETTPIWDGSTALLKKLGQERYDLLRKKANELTAQYQTLVDNGATMDELAAIYKDTPDVWKPPRFREEEKNWVAMKSLLDAETEDQYAKETKTKLAKVDEKIEAFKSKLETGETIAKLLGKGFEGLGKLGETIAEKLETDKALAEKGENVLALAAKLMTLVQAPLKALDSGLESMETEDPVEMMMLQDEFMSSLGEWVSAIGGLQEPLDKLEIGGALIKQISNLLPGIGVATNAADVMTGLVASAARIQEAMEDAESHAEALQGEHRGEAAIDQFARRDKHLAARAATKTGVAMIKTAAAGIDMTGVGVTAGTVMKGVATGISGVQTVAEQVIDREEGEKARALLERAQAGDAPARAELFRFHPRYAKGILAIMASEGDALALKVLSTHGLNEAMIRKSSPMIVKRFLMKKFGESDTPPSWTSAKEAIVAKVETVASLFASIDRFLDNLADKLLARIDPNELVAAQARLGDLAYQLSNEADISSAAAALSEIKMRRDALAESAEPGQVKDLVAVDKALEAEAQKVAKLRQRLLASLGTVRSVRAGILKQKASALRTKAEDAAKQALAAHLARVERLATAG